MFSLICALNKRLSKHSCGWWFETPSRPLWRHCNEVEARRVPVRRSWGIWVNVRYELITKFKEISIKTQLWTHFISYVEQSRALYHHILKPFFCRGPGTFRRETKSILQLLRSWLLLLPGHQKSWWMDVSIVGILSFMKKIFKLPTPYLKKMYSYAHPREKNHWTLQGHDTFLLERINQFPKWHFINPI